MSLQSDRDLPQVGFDDARARAAIGERNRIREAAKLPALSVKEQLQRMKAAYDQNRFEEFMRSPLREMVQQRLLDRMRRPEAIQSGYLLAFCRAVAISSM
jgi:hypothetical protein